jgi:hypothetical protein
VLASHQKHQSAFGARSQGGVGAVRRKRVEADRAVAVRPPLLKREYHDRVRHADALRKEKGASSVQDLGGADLIDGSVGGQWRAMRDGNDGSHGNRGNAVSVSYRF